jgi:signal transduction histidine kinase
MQEPTVSPSNGPLVGDMRTEVLDLIAHDLRNPLNAICLGVRLLREKKLTPEREARQIRLMESACHRMNGLIEDLLALARIEAGDFQLHRSPVAVRVLVDEALRINRATAEEVGLRLASVVEPGVLTARVDAVRVARALGIMVDFAVQRSTASGLVMIRATGTDSVLNFEITDEGPELDDVNEMFKWRWTMEPGSYRRGDASLALARRLIELHGGEVAIEGPNTVRFTMKAQTGSLVS